MSQPQATITKDPYFDPFRRVERPRWRIDTNNPRLSSAYTRTRREAIEWCQDLGFEVVHALNV